MLVDEGKVSLDDPVEKYLPEFRGQMLTVEKGRDRLVLKKPQHPITVREILSHTSGLRRRSPLEQQLDTLAAADRDHHLRAVAAPVRPGTRYEYCNPGINTAGRIIEVVSGVPYEDFLQQRIFEPLGMKDTTFWPGGSNFDGWRSRTGPARTIGAWRNSPSRSSRTRWMIGSVSLTRPAASSPRRPTYSSSAG